AGYVEEAVLTDYVLETGEATSKDERPPLDGASRMVIPVTVDDLAANDLMGKGYPQTCWERSVETLWARKDDIEGLAVASDEQIEACILYTKDTGELLAVQALVERGEFHLTRLTSQLRSRGLKALRFPKVHRSEVSSDVLRALGFRSAATYRLCTTMARSG